MEHIPFTHLHTHSPEGSLLDGFMRIEKAIDKAKRLGMDALGISDHGTMAAHEKFYNVCKENGIHPVLGMEAYETVDKRMKKADFEAVDYPMEGESYIFALLTEEEAGEDYHLVDEIRPKKAQTPIVQNARDFFLLDLVSETLTEGQELPKARGGLTRMINAYLKEVKKSEGKELYIKADTSVRDHFEWYPHIGHLLLIAKDNDGYQNLLKLNSIGQMEGFYGKPRIDREDMKKYGSGIIASTACLGSIPSQLILRGKPEEAKEHILLLQECFDELYLEIQPSKQEDQRIVNEQLIEWSEELDIPLLATSDVHMVDSEELHIHAGLTNIGKGGSNDSSDQDSDISVYDSAYMMTPEEILAHGIPRIALQNAYDLSHRCQVDFLEQTWTKFPEYEVPDSHDFNSYLRKLAEEGLFELFLTKGYIEDYNEYQDRLNYELGIISDKGLSAYFIIVWDYIRFARDNDIYVGPGRGSAAGSLVAYVLGITNVDPIRYNLLFERFLNPERESLPDIDTDFDYLRRDEVLDYIVKKYGEERVAKIGTYTKMSSKLVLKDVGRTLGVDHNLINRWNKELPVDNGNVMDLAEAVETVPIFREAQSKYPELFELALDLQSMPRSAGIHACFIYNTSIQTDKGIKSIKDIQLGDMVLTKEKRFKPVIELYVNEAEELFTLETNAEKVTGTGNHPFWVAKLIKTKPLVFKSGKPLYGLKFRDPAWTPLEEIKEGDYVLYPDNPNETKLRPYLYPEDVMERQIAYKTKEGIWLEVKGVTSKEEKATVYNFQVEEDHSYTANGLAVKNCGIQIAPVDLNDNIPVRRGKDSKTKEDVMVTQYEGGNLESLGFLKFDILGLKNLSVLRIAVDEIEKRHGVRIDLEELVPEDEENKPVFEMIRSGDTQAIFQLELKLAPLTK